MDFDGFRVGVAVQRILRYTREGGLDNYRAAQEIIHRVADEMEDASLVAEDLYRLLDSIVSYREDTGDGF